ncbi:hypothetical protein GEMRC1_011240 [Eukaryota sp. GEM-RC1]
MRLQLIDHILSSISTIHKLPNGLQDDVVSAIHIIHQAFLRFSPSEIVVSFNGGKDNTVVLFLTLYYCALQSISNALDKPNSGLGQQNLSLTNTPPPSLRVVYFETHHSFPEMLQYMSMVANHFNFSVQKYSGTFHECLTQVSNDGVKAVIAGIRRTDPHSANLSPITASSKGWPEIYRVCPILDWSYADVWTFIDQCDLPYCPLYKLGYTSLGTPSTTKPNPLLVQADGTFSHARDLEREEHERLGRG